jgi:hypothetical protein
MADDGRAYAIRALLGALLQSYSAANLAMSTRKAV